ncbi:DNA translocase FtsK [Allorhizobium undicola]|uniref:DNA translocase FtsK n=1 Tax=Allorhizobium undicola TaxID=78527 RepID=UPI0006864994|nr:DNA translocase FtsK [Allorhizobium undicola]
MRFPPNSSHPNADQTGEDARSVHQAAQPQGRDQAGQPLTPPEQLEPWHKAFVLGPNVRFTRTPESAILRRREAEAAAAAQAAEAAQQQAVAAPPVTEMPITEPVVKSPAFFGLPKTGAPLLIKNVMRKQADAPRTDPVSDAPAVEAVVETPAMTAEPVVDAASPIVVDVDAQKLRQAAAIMRMPEHIEVHLRHEEEAIADGKADSPQPAQPANFAPVTSSHLPALAISDFAFFEMMPDDMAEPAPEVTIAVKAAALPQRQSMPLVGSVAALYREVKPKRAAAESVAQPLPQSLPQPVQPVHVASVADIPPAAPGLQTVEISSEPPLRLEVSAQPVAEIAPQAETMAVQGEPMPWEEPSAAAASLVLTAQPAAEIHPVVETVQERPRQIVEATPRLQRALGGGIEIARNHPFDGDFTFPSIDLLQEPPAVRAEAMLPEALEQSAGLLESVLEDFGIRGEVIDVRPGPVVTLYEFEPAPGIKSSRVIGLSDDIARSMSALSARVAVVPGRNVIGIELPNAVRETVYLRELIECEDYWESKYKLALCLGKSIGGEPVIAELAKMPHLLVAGTTGSGKSVAINTMILSLLYRLKPEECRLIMVDPKMLELSVYDGIPHLLTPVVTDPKKAVMALKWAVREMEDRYRKMSRLGVRNIDGYNERAAQARDKGEIITVSIQTGFDRHSGEPVYEDQDLDLSPMPYIVIIVDEMADLMMVAGKEIEGAIQRLAQMARAAGIHLIMATQRPSVDVITGTIKANFPTRISFQVTSKIDSRTILGEQGAEHLLGQGDMLQMVGGGRIQRVHGPFVSDAEVEQVVAHLKTQGRPEYLGTVTEEEGGDAQAVEEVVERGSTPASAGTSTSDDSDDLYEKAVKVVLRDQKCSTSYIQRRLSIGYNRAASLVERMEREGLVGAANHVGKREIIAGGGATGAGQTLAVDESD